MSEASQIEGLLKSFLGKTPMSREFIGRLWSDPQVGAGVPSQRVRLETSKINE